MGRKQNWHIRLIELQTFQSVKHKMSEQNSSAYLHFQILELWFYILPIFTILNMFQVLLKSFCSIPHKLNQCWKLLLLQRAAKHRLFKNKRPFSFSKTSIPPIYSLKTKVPSPILSVFVCQTRELARMSAVIEPRPVHCVRDVPQLCNCGIDRDMYVLLFCSWIANWSSTSGTQSYFTLLWSCTDTRVFSDSGHTF